MKESTPFDPHSQVLAGAAPMADLMPGISVDCVILGFEEDQLKVLLVQHNGGPKDGEWALPGDFVRKSGNLSDMPYEVLKRLTGIEDIFVTQLGAFGDVERVDYRRIITIAYYALVSPQKYTLKIGPAAKDVKWFQISKTPPLIFDHNEILNAAIAKLRRDLAVMPIGYELLPETFTLTQMQRLYEAILGEKLDTRNFRRKILKSKVLMDTGLMDKSVPYRAPKLYTFNKIIYEEQLKNSFSIQF